MLGKRQSGLDGGEHAYLDHVGRDSFYGFLASHRRELFHDKDFADLYCSDNGRPSVPPSLLAMALLLQAYDGVSDEKAKARADFDLRWKVALKISLEERPFAKSTLQLFRARLIIHERVRTVFQKSLDFARHTGYLRSRRTQGRFGHQLHTGAGSGKGHLQPAGRRDRHAGTKIGRRSPLRVGGVGAGAWPGALLRLVFEGRGGHRLGRSPGQGRVLGKRGWGCRSR